MLQNIASWLLIEVENLDQFVRISMSLKLSDTGMTI